MAPGTLTLILGLIIFALFVAAAYLFVILTSKDETLQQMQQSHQKLMRSFHELDEQARLIVKTDLELNKAQEELDKRLNGLNALQRTSRQISQAFNENEIFQKLSPTLFEELGFAFVLLVTIDEEQVLHVRNNINVEATKAQNILNEFQKDDHLKNALKENHIFSSINASNKTKEKLIQIFGTEHFILAPIFTQAGAIGFVFVGNRYNAPAVTQGDEELIAILASQIGQAAENAQLFEKVFKSSQELEIKVKDRTKQLASALEKVEEISQKKSEFISAVSHELRTPLTSIKGYAAILIAGKIGEVPVAVKERLAKINTHSDNLVSLINNLLDIARIESGRVEMSFGMYKTKTIVDNVMDLLTPQVSAKGCKLVSQVPAEVPEFYIDASQAERVFINLLSNAVKFTPKDGTITISADTKTDKGFITFSVTDTGIGIAPDDLKKLFSEFFRVENEINQSVKGTGLGLVLAKNIVQAHHGKMWVQSQVGKGTTFLFTLPSSKEAFDQKAKEHIV